MMMIGTPTTKEDYAFGRQHEEDRENRFAEIFHQMMMQDFRFMEAARIQSGEYEDANINTEELKCEFGKYKNSKICFNRIRIHTNCIFHTQIDPELKN